MQKKVSNVKSIFWGVGLVLVMLLLVLQPHVYMQATLSGLVIWLNNVLPALFPFFFFSGLLLKLDLFSSLGDKLRPIVYRLFHCSGGAGLIFLISIVSGYPVGAKVTLDLYQQKLLTQDEVLRINSFASTSGPLFIVGAVGVGMLHSHVVGLVLLFSHYIGAVLNGLLYRNYHFTPTRADPVALSRADQARLSDTMYSSIISILLVGGFIVIFFILIQMLSSLGVIGGVAHIFSYFGLLTNFVQGFLSGIIEVTTGCQFLSEIHLSSILVASIGALIGWGGISIHAQALTFLSPCGMSTRLFILQKFTQSLFSFIVCFLLCGMFI